MQISEELILWAFNIHMPLWGKNEWETAYLVVQIFVEQTAADIHEF